MICSDVSDRNTFEQPPHGFSPLAHSRTIIFFRPSFRIDAHTPPLTYFGQTFRHWAPAMGPLYFQSLAHSMNLHTTTKPFLYQQLRTLPRKTGGTPFSVK